MQDKAFFISAKEKVLAICKRKSVRETSFSDEAMEQIKETDEFLRLIILGPLTEDEAKQSLEHLCIVAKWKEDKKEAFIPKTFTLKSFFYNKDPLYIAKCCYLLSQEPTIQLYYCVNTVGAAFSEQYGHMTVERKKDNIRTAKSVFTDIDLSEEMKQLSDTDLLQLLYKNYGTFIEKFDATILHSGNGLHFYIPIEAIDLTNEEHCKEYVSCLDELITYMWDIGADPVCHDITRILRICNGYNRKTNPPKQVRVLRMSSTRQSFEEVYNFLRFENSGGTASLYGNIMEDLYYDNVQYKYTDEGKAEESIKQFLDDIRNGLIEDPFADETDSYVYDPTVSHTFNPSISQHEEEEIIGEDALEEYLSTRQENTSEKTVRTERNKKERKERASDSNCHFVSIREVPRNIKENDYWQNIDLIFWLQNRDEHQGYRNEIVFVFLYNYYYKLNLQNFESLYRQISYINTRYIRPCLDDNELFKYTNAALNRFVTKFKWNGKGIKNSTIQELFRFDEEELKHTIGNYYPKGSQEFIDKDRERDKIFHRNRSTTYKAYEAKQKLIYETFKENPYMSLEEAEALGFSARLYRYCRQKFGITKEWKDTRNTAKETIKNNPKMTYKEFSQQFNLSKRTFIRYREELGIVDNLRKEKEDMINYFINNPNITFKEIHEKYGIGRTAFYRYKNKYSKK